MNLDPSSPMANPDLSADLLAERFSRLSTAMWWPTPKAHRDSDQMRYFRRLELEAANQDDEESA